MRGCFLGAVSWSHAAMVTASLCALACPPTGVAQSQAPASSQVVEVTGRGDTRWRAREDAIRQALQQVVTQLVIADREIRGNEVIRDDVRSTLNGYVERFEVLAQDVQADQHVVRARIHVSPSRLIAAMRQAGNGATQPLDGATIGAAVAAKRMKDSTTAVMVARLLRVLPSEVVDGHVDGVRVDVEDEQVDVALSLGTNDGFVSLLQEGFRALAASNAAVSPCAFQRGTALNYSYSLEGRREQHLARDPQCASMKGAAFYLEGAQAQSLWRLSAGASEPLSVLLGYLDTMFNEYAYVAIHAGNSLVMALLPRKVHGERKRCSQEVDLNQFDFGVQVISSCLLRDTLSLPAQLFFEAKDLRVDPFPPLRVPGEDFRRRVERFGNEWFDSRNFAGIWYAFVSEPVIRYRGEDWERLPCNLRHPEVYFQYRDVPRAACYTRRGARR